MFVFVYVVVCEWSWHGEGGKRLPFIRSSTAKKKRKRKGKTLLPYPDRLSVGILETEVTDGVGQRAAHEELGREVEDMLGVGGAVFVLVEV